jgi:hypothetical protein
MRGSISKQSLNYNSKQIASSTFQNYQPGSFQWTDE